MARTKKQADKQADKEEWIEVQEATRIISKNSGRPISDAYVRLLGKQGKIGMKPKDGRTNLYLKSSVQDYKVRQRGDGTVSRERAAKQQAGQQAREEAVA